MKVFAKLILLAVVWVIAVMFIFPHKAKEETPKKGTLLYELMENDIVFVDNSLVYVDKAIAEEREDSYKGNFIKNFMGWFSGFAKGTGRGSGDDNSLYAEERKLVLYCGPGLKKVFMAECDALGVDFDSYTTGITFSDSEYARIPDVTWISSTAFLAESDIKYIEISGSKATYVEEGAFDGLAKLERFYGSSKFYDIDERGNGKLAKYFNDSYDLDKSIPTKDEELDSRVYWLQHGFIKLLVAVGIPLIVLIIFAMVAVITSDEDVEFFRVFPFTLAFVVSLIAIKFITGVDARIVYDFAIWNNIVLILSSSCDIALAFE
ncbi:MAG: hypothetical protein LBT59_11820 [Clostridiales bacterium]|jgi:hypothetical protein|nr:hypothetical protein [Clostridiales bacterium]